MSKRTTALLGEACSAHEDRYMKTRESRVVYADEDPDVNRVARLQPLHHSDEFTDEGARFYRAMAADRQRGEMGWAPDRKVMQAFLADPFQGLLPHSIHAEVFKKRFGLYRRMVFLAMSGREEEASELSRYYFTLVEVAARQGWKLCTRLSAQTQMARRLEIARMYREQMAEACGMANVDPDSQD